MENVGFPDDFNLMAAAFVLAPNMLGLYGACALQSLSFALLIPASVRYVNLYIAPADCAKGQALIAGMKKDAAIWNINSFGEFYMQIAEKYVKNYAAALRKFKATRKTMGEALGGIPALRVIPSQANYFMLELTGNVSARELTRRLLTEHDILVKDLSAKLAQSGRQYVRVAVRTEEDNARLIAALKEILK